MTFIVMLDIWHLYPNLGWEKKTFSLELLADVA